jgi:copper chaperone CopZ
MKEVSIKVDGMSCQHCVMRVKNAIDGVEGVHSSDVSIGSAKVVFDETKTDRESIERAIQSVGYKISS